MKIVVLIFGLGVFWETAITTDCKTVILFTFNEPSNQYIY